MAGWLSRAVGALAGLVAAVGALACASAEIQQMPQGALIVDVRTPAEYQAGHFPGAINIPLDEIGNRIAEFGDKSRSIVVYCRSGRRSGLAKQQLSAAGYANVKNGGGLEEMLRFAPGGSAEK